MKQGSYGQDVADLKARLKEIGYNPGDKYGVFDDATEQAVIAYQKCMHLLADGIAGPRTLSALGLTDDNTLPYILPLVTVEIVSKMFPHTPIANIRRNLPFVLEALRVEGLTDKPMVLMALATIRAETEGFEPISEGQSKYNTSPGGHPFDLYDLRTDLGNYKAGEGERFKGRGFIQLTGRSNYRRYGTRLPNGKDLYDDPELANDPKIAAQLLAVFLRDRERAIKEALLDDNLRLARKLVNGGSHGLDRFAEAYHIGDRLIA